MSHDQGPAGQEPSGPAVVEERAAAAERGAAGERAPEQAASERPVLRVVRGAPTPEELAALIAVLSAAAASPSPTGPRAPASTWNDRARAVRAPLSPGPGAWRASALPS